MRTFDKLTIDEVFCLLLLTVKNQTTRFCQVLQRRGAVVIVGSPTPEGLFVQLDFLRFGAAIDHGAHAGITKRNSLEPYCSGTVVPQSLVIIRLYACFCK